MNSEGQKLSFKPLMPKMALFMIVGMLMIITGIFIFLLCLLSSVMFLIKILLSLFGILCFILGYFLLSFPFMTRLILSEDYIFFKQPYASVSCQWTNINGYQITREQFFLKYDQSPKVSISIPGVLLGIRRLDIPVHFFVRGWTTDEDWHTEEILMRIDSRIPNLKNIVFENMPQ